MAIETLIVEDVHPARALRLKRPVRTGLALDVISRDRPHVVALAGRVVRIRLALFGRALESPS